MHNPATPRPRNTWAQDAKDLLAIAPDWTITRADSDPMTLVCARRRGTEVRVIAGSPRVCLDRISDIVMTEHKPAIVRADRGAWISGPGAS
jgi:hypothetical protein